MPPMKKTAIKGKVDGILGVGVSGWVYNKQRLEERIWVELLAENISLSVARAENYHQEVSHIGDGCYGFWLPIPPVLLEGFSEVELRVKVVNTEIFLEPSVKLPKSKSLKNSLSQVFYTGGLRISGWVIDETDPERTVTVSFWSEGRCIGRALASEKRSYPDYTNGHGFKYTLPVKFADGKLHYIDVRDDRGRSLNGSPVPVQVVPESFSIWIKNKRNIKPKEKKIIEEILSRYEELLPHSLGFEIYTSWKELYPPPKISISLNENTIAVCHYETKVKELLEISKKFQYILFLPHLSKLTPEALKHFVFWAKETEASLLYADEELKEGTFPLFKPCWDLFLFIGYDYLGPILVKSSEIKKADLSPEDHPIELRTKLILNSPDIYHIPYPLIQRSLSPFWKNELEHRKRLLEDWFRQKGISLELLKHPLNKELFKVRFKCKKRPLVTIIIPTKDKVELLKKCISSIWELTSYPDYELLIVDNLSERKETKDFFKKIKEKGGKIISYPYPFNFSAMMNEAVKKAKGEIVCLLNNDTEIADENWLEEMVSLLELPKVGAVGAKLLWKNGLVQHGGVIVGVHKLADHVGNHWHETEPGYMNRNLLVQQWSAVTAACMLTYKDLFIKQGGFDGLRFPISFNDVDFCLRLREKGYKILWTPFVKIYHHESATRGKNEDKDIIDKMRSERERYFFYAKWGKYEDPFYNPNLTLSTFVPVFEGLAFPPRERKPRRG